MMRPGLTADGLAVRVPVGETLLAPLLDDLAVAYAEDPNTLGALLAVHAESVRRLDHAACSITAPDHERAVASALADGSREALLAELPAEHHDPQFGPDAAITLAGRLTRLAGHIRHTRKATP
ncbi:hypothetical protein [Streptomyces sp. NPDC057729]|uniref:hypothetical protein n=1 Tax=Streptomyces sp. NPDC057729 TaxID=3346230 RepID=UPI003675F7A2